MINCTIAIPARIASTRLPGKMLRLLGGKPVIQHVIERARQVRQCQAIYVVTDSHEIVDLAQQLGATGILTSPHCHSGTERIVSVLNQIQGDWIFNIQGDEPFIEPKLIEGMMAHTTDVSADMLTPIYPLQTLEAIQNPNIVKVVCDREHRALYFSRSPIPFIRDIPPEQWVHQYTFWGHIGIYGYRRNLLEAYPSLVPSPLETAESLEQLRFLSYGYSILTYETSHRSVAIDTAEDLVKAETLLRSGQA